MFTLVIYKLNIMYSIDNTWSYCIDYRIQHRRIHGKFLWNFKIDQKQVYDIGESTLSLKKCNELKILRTFSQGYEAEYS